MPAALQEWKVLPHSKLERVNDSILTVTGDIHMPLMEFPRRMTVVKLNDRRLIVYSAIALNEKSMAELEAFGRPAYLVVPNDKHRMDAKIWKNRYPEMRVVTPEGSRKKVEEVVPVDTSAPRFDDPSVQFVTVPGTREQDSALVVAAKSGTTLVVNDIIGNIRNASGFAGWMLRRMGFAGDQAQVPGVAKLLMIKDQSALRAQLLEWAAIDSLERILVSHGAPIEGNAREVLRGLAGSLK